MTTRHLVRAEYLKLRTTRVVWALFGATVALSAASVAGTVSTFSEPGSAVELASAQGIRGVMNAADAGSLFVLVLAILAVTGEFRHGTAAQTFLAEPRRERVVAAKLITFALVGLAFSIVASAVSVAIALPWLDAKGVSVPLAHREVRLVLTGVVVASVLYGLVGVGVGALVRNQAAAVVGSVVWLLVVEGVFINLVPDVGAWLPGGAAAGLTRGILLSGEELLPMWAGGLLFLGYSVVLAGIGTRAVLRRDAV